LLELEREESPYRLFGLSAGDSGTAASARTHAPPRRAPWLRHELQLETPRLLLRTYGSRDHDPLHHMVSDPEMFLFSHRDAMSSDESWTLLLRHIGHWQLFGYGVFAIVEKESGRIVGESGVCDFRRRLGGSFDNFPEITWSIIPSAQGRGYATEAAAAVLAWLEREHRMEQTVCLIHEDNAASIAVAEKLGYRRFDRCRYRNYTALLMRRGEDFEGED
jgi:RimJ/RimL family protein N-acetyltransferase